MVFVILTIIMRVKSAPLEKRRGLNGMEVEVDSLIYPF
jgi:hypothetical protein